MTAHYHEGIFATSPNGMITFTIAETITDGYLGFDFPYIVNLRSPFGGNGLRCHDDFRDAFYNLIHRQGSGLSLRELTNHPIIFLDEHEAPDVSKSRILVQKEIIDGEEALRIRFVQWIQSNTLAFNVAAILSGNTSTRSRKDSVIYVSNDSQSMMNEDDFGRFIRLLAITHRIQLNKYQDEIDRLLSIPSPP